MLALLIALVLSPRAAALPPERAWEDLLPRVRAAPADLGIRPERSDARLPVKAVEAMLSDPLTEAPVLRRWRAALAAGLSSEDSLRFAASLLDLSPADEKPASVSCPDIPASMRGAIEGLAGSLVSAQALARRASDSLEPAVRARALAQLGGSALGEQDRPLEPALFDELKVFRADLMSGAASTAASAIDRALPLLRRSSAGAPAGHWTCATSAGPVIVSGAQGAEHDASELAGALAVVGLGGNSVYRGPAAAAGAGQVRVVVDLGQAVIESTGAAAGSGVFGVGLLYLPSAAPATVSAGDFSLGAGFFGAGAAFVSGAGSRLSSGRFSQGAGAFGLGVLSVSAASAAVSAEMTGQGFGMTRGAGLLLARGDGGTLRCGLVVADPHEERAAASLCQGVGFGPRAYAAGGVGLADVTGDRWELTSSYFAQGAGYWHGLGALFLNGSADQVQARRYSQGTGVHSAAGALLVDGSRERFVNWGVGPAYGWDLGVGMLDATGDASSFQTDWSAGRAEFNGRSLVSVSGDRNQLRLPGLGTADFRRGAPGYALALVSGRGNRIWQERLARPIHGAFEVTATPWGVLKVEGQGWLDASVSSRAAAWPVVDRRGAALKDALALERLGPRPGEGAAALAWDLFVASDFAFAPREEGEAARRLLSLPEEQASELLDSFAPERFDEDLWIRVAFCGLGRGAAGAAQERIRAARGLSRALDLGLLRCQPAATAVPSAYELISDPDWRVRKEAAGLIGYVLGRQGGGEPGRLADLQSALSLFSGELSPDDFALALGRKRPSDLLALLGLGPAPTPAQRLDLLGRAGNPFDPVSLDALRGFARLLMSGRDDLEPDFAGEMRGSQDLRNMARSALDQAAGASEPDAEVRAAALVALGALGEPADARALQESLDSPSAAVREAASYGLAQLGAGAGQAIAGELKSASPRRRLAAVLAAAQSTDAASFGLLRGALRSSDDGERALAVAGLSAVQPPMEVRRKDLLPELRRLAQDDPSSSVRATAAAMLAQLGAENAP